MIYSLQCDFFVFCLSRRRRHRHQLNNPPPLAISPSIWGRAPRPRVPPVAQLNPARVSCNASNHSQDKPGNREPQFWAKPSHRRPGWPPRCLRADIWRCWWLMIKTLTGPSISEGEGSGSMILGWNRPSSRRSRLQRVRRVRMCRWQCSEEGQGWEGLSGRISCWWAN